MVFNFIYSKVADILTARENHRTDTEFEDSMISKLFLFQFVNSYASFFYIAFIAPYQPASPGANDNWKGDCGAKNCMIPLA
ncbi:Ano4, partial [Symbiodinium microadriaticum]